MQPALQPFLQALNVNVFHCPRATTGSHKRIVLLFVVLQADTTSYIIIIISIVAFFSSRLAIVLVVESIAMGVDLRLAQILVFLESVFLFLILLIQNVKACANFFYSKTQSTQFYLIVELQSVVLFKKIFQFVNLLNETLFNCF